MISLKKGDLVKVVGFRVDNSIVKKWFKVGDICKVVEIKRGNKKIATNVLCDLKAMEFCKRSSAKQCIKIRNMDNEQEAWICDIEVELIDNLGDK